MNYECFSFMPILQQNPMVDAAQPMAMATMVDGTFTFDVESL
jgi:hypothetical protein